ncbi:MAG: hypothetical protein ABIE92_05900 [bacterium]
MTKLTEEQIRLIAKISQEEMGENANLDQLRDVVQQVADHLESKGPLPQPAVGNPLVICISGDSLKNSQTLSEALKETGCRVSDRSEKIIGHYHTLMALLDNQNCTTGLDGLGQKLQDAGNRMGVRIMLLTEEVFRGRSNSI